MILEAKNVSYYYKSQRDKLILDHVSYGFECGKLYAILGPSGSGKTTLLSLLAGLDVPIQGEICYDGKPITTKDLAEHRRHHISLVFQSYNLIDYLTPLENVKLGGKGDPKALLGSMGIGEEYWNRSVLQLSGGQQQRVAIARALVNNPAVILADEATGNLDTRTSFEILVLFQKLYAEGRTIIFVTHNPDIAKYSSRNIELRDGHIISDTYNDHILSAAEGLAALPANTDE